MVGAYDVIECPLSLVCPYRKACELCAGLRVLNCKYFARFLDQLLKWMLVNIDELETTHFVIRSSLREGKIVVEVRSR